VEGSGNNKALEIFNGTGADVDLSDYQIKLFNNGSSTASATLVLSGILANGSVLALCNSQASTALKAQCNLVPAAAVMAFNGNDGIQLQRASGALVDRIGDNTDPGAAGWVGGAAATKDQTLRRKCSVTHGDTHFTAAFDPSVEWDAFPMDTFTDVGSYGCGTATTGSTAGSTTAGSTAGSTSTGTSSSGSTSTGTSSSSGSSGASSSGSSTAGSSSGSTSSGAGSTSGSSTGSSLTGVFFSEYVEGSSSNKALEIVNVTGATFDLSQLTIKLFANGSQSVTQTLALTGTLPSGAVYTLCNPAASSALKTRCSGNLAPTPTGNVTNFNGNDGLELVETATGLLVDSIGNNTDPGSAGWHNVGSTVTTTDHTLRRKCTVARGDTNFRDAYDPSAEWDVFAADTFTDVGTYSCAVATTGSSASGSSGSSTGSSAGSSGSGSSGSDSSSGSSGAGSTGSDSSSSSSGSSGSSGAGSTSGSTGTAPTYTDLVITEYVRGADNDSALEIYNGTAQTLSLADYRVSLFAHGATVATATFTPTGTLSAGDTYVLCHTNFGVFPDGGVEDPAVFCSEFEPDVTAFGGGDGVVLTDAIGTVVDSIGSLTPPDGGAWTDALGTTSTLGQDLRRRCTDGTADVDFTDAYDPSVSYTPFAVTDFSDLGKHVCLFSFLGPVRPTATEMLALRGLWMTPW
jgi:predicted extracellular nuclease